MTQRFSVKTTIYVCVCVACAQEGYTGIQQYVVHFSPDPLDHVHGGVLDVLVEIPFDVEAADGQIEAGRDDVHALGPPRFAGRPAEQLLVERLLPVPEPAVGERHARRHGPPHQVIGVHAPVGGRERGRQPRQVPGHVDHDALVVEYARPAARAHQPVDILVPRHARVTGGQLAHRQVLDGLHLAPTRRLLRVV